MDFLRAKKIFKKQKIATYWKNDYMSVFCFLRRYFLHDVLVKYLNKYDQQEYFLWCNTFSRMFDQIPGKALKICQDSTFQKMNNTIPEMNKKCSHVNVKMRSQKTQQTGRANSKSNSFLWFFVQPHNKSDAVKRL